jgi:hypothetical protein
MELEPEAEGDDCELEDGANEEPSLGSHEVREAGPVSHFARAVYAAGEMILDCEGDEHDGREPGDSGIGDHDGLLEQVRLARLATCGDGVMVMDPISEVAEEIFDLASLLGVVLAGLMPTGA